MNTKFIGIKEFRQNIAKYATKAQGARTRFIVVNHNRPMFEVTPFAPNTTLDSLFSDILAAKKDIATGKVFTQDEILAELG
jgi:hypothetical protein